MDERTSDASSRVKALDGIRGLAILLVLIFHLPIVFAFVYFCNKLANYQLIQLGYLKLLFFTFAFIVTFLFAYLSWRFIEKPALSFKKYFPR